MSLTYPTSVPVASFCLFGACTGGQAQSIELLQTASVQPSSTCVHPTCPRRDRDACGQGSRVLPVRGGGPTTGAHLDRAVMCLRNFARNVQTESKTALLPLAVSLRTGPRSSGSKIRVSVSGSIAGPPFETSMQTSASSSVAVTRTGLSCAPYLSEFTTRLPRGAGTFRCVLSFLTHVPLLDPVPILFAHADRGEIPNGVALIPRASCRRAERPTRPHERPRSSRMRALHYLAPTPITVELADQQK